MNAFQIAFPTVHSRALTTMPRGWALHGVGAHDALLLTLTAASDRRSAAAWHETISAAFPTLR